MFSFYQIIWSVITVALVGITSAITFVCIDEPYTRWFGVGFGVIILAEILALGSWIRALGCKNRNLPVTMTYVYPWWLYFLFTLLMTMAACGHMLFSYFILLHVIGFVAAVVFCLLLSMGEHNVRRQDKETAAGRAGKLQLKSQAAELHDLILEKFADNLEMRKVADKVADFGAYATNSIAGSEDADDKLSDQMNALKEQLAAACTEEEIKAAVNSLGHAFTRRNNLIKEFR